MRLLPSGDAGVLAEFDTLAEVVGMHAALAAEPPAGVLDVVPAARTVLLVLDPSATTVAAVSAAVRATSPRPAEEQDRGEVLELPVHYDGEDVDDVAGILGCTPGEVVTRHTGTTWTVAFGGFAPGFGYLTADDGDWDIPRRSTPRTRVPAGAVGLAGEFSGVYPRESPGGWQLLGHTETAVFDLAREPAALLRPGARVRFVDVTPR